MAKVTAQGQCALNATGAPNATAPHSAHCCHGHSMPKLHTLPTAAIRGLSALGVAVTSGLSPASVPVHPSPWFRVPEGVPLAEPGQMSESQRGWQMRAWGMERKSLVFSDYGLGRKALPITKIYKGRFLTSSPHFLEDDRMLNN